MEDHSYYEKTEFPPIEDFYNNLKRKELSKRKYNRAKEIYIKSECRNFGEYYDLYCLQDVLNLQIVLRSLETSVSIMKTME